MAAKRSLVADYLVYLLVRLVIGVLQALPLRLALCLARPLAWLAHRIDRRHRLVAAENLRHAFPALADAAIDRLVWDCYLHFATMLLEIVFLPRLARLDTLAAHLNYRVPADFDRVVGLLNSGRPLLVLTGHLGNWEVMSYAIGMAGYASHVIARRLDNPYLDRFLWKFRSRTGQRVLSKNEDYPRIREVLAEGGYLAMLGDQDAGPRGVFVDFFGRPASTFKAIGLLALEHRAVILVIGAVRVGQPIRYELLVPDVIDAAEYADRHDAVRQITQRYTTALESLIRQYPEQYFWPHRRWKHQPPQRRKNAA